MTGTTLPIDPDSGFKPTPQTKACPSGRGSKMVQVGDLNDGGFCIDAYEATSIEYNQFLGDLDAGTPAQQPESCSWNRDFKPATIQNSRLPIRHIDWCDAFAYCEWAGKHLCGDRNGGSTRGINTIQDQWYFACTKGGDDIGHPYPYGTTYSSTRCNTGRDDGNNVVSVGSKTLCTGGFPGIYDMSGNVWEFTDSCSGTESEPDHSKDRCQLRGGGPLQEDSTARCDTVFTGSRGGKFEDVGVRCCAH